MIYHAWFITSQQKTICRLARIGLKSESTYFLDDKQSIENFDKNPGQHGDGKDNHALTVSKSTGRNLKFECNVDGDCKFFRVCNAKECVFKKVKQKPGMEYLNYILYICVM